MKLIKKYYKETLMIICGNMILGFSYGAFLIPRKIVAGGSSGLALILSKIVPLSPTVLVMIIIWFFFFVGFIIFGKKFAMKALLATIVLPLATALPERIPIVVEEIAKIEQLWVVALIAGMTAGLGIGITFRVGGSTGGLDVLGYIIQKYLKIRLSWVIFAIDALIMFAGIWAYSLESVLVGICIALFMMIATDRVLFGGNNSMQAQIITEKTTETLEFIHKTLERGSTIYNVEGGFSQRQYRLIQVFLSRRELEDLKDFLEKIDPDAFMSILKANAVIGEGFKSWRDL